MVSALRTQPPLYSATWTSIRQIGCRGLEEVLSPTASRRGECGSGNLQKIHDMLGLLSPVSRDKGV